MRYRYSLFLIVSLDFLKSVAYMTLKSFFLKQNCRDLFLLNLYTPLKHSQLAFKTTIPLLGRKHPKTPRFLRFLFYNKTGHRQINTVLN